ncbi:bacillithiol biosynthesis cysteine-adding enzyme BshC [Robertkochia flava]|uniref:bacillithiol biosynthesis cysteine-adding enzyme BshC n=1 Tax=Robertkochia flava TaxID=3447986 RepID=UPI001CCBE27B|nr:bacillithiol biosynthesis cysteine-adding enzyme BshC [Robertkochia marina]
MTLETVDFKSTGYFSDLICDYLSKKEALSSFYNRYPDVNAFKAQIEEKEGFTDSHRKVLSEQLSDQYTHLETSGATLSNIAALAKPNTYTITTGHQLNLFTGPLYFLYKIVSVINLCKTLKEAYPQHHFVPVYWMATEDHDFEEINFFNFNGKKFQWQGPEDETQGGAVGRMSTHHLEEVAALFTAELGPGKFAEELRDLFKEAYLKHPDLTSATRFLANALFAGQGLVIVDGDDPGLKREFIPYIKEDLLKNTAYHQVQGAIEKLQALPANYNVQVNPREINLFYLEKGSRDRIIFDGDYFGLAEGTRKWSESSLMEEVESHPERFSPNVLLRPLYQEVILPNLCYIGGGGELAYWLELRDFFEASEVPMPMLLLRDSVLMITSKQKGKLDRLHVSVNQLFTDRHALINRKVREISDIPIDFSPEREHLIEQFKRLYELAEKTDKSFLNAVKAQEVKQIKGLNKLEKRLLKAQKRKLEDHVERLTALHNELFPNGSLQERSSNFSQWYHQYGSGFIELLLQNLDPLDARFKVITV